MSAPRTVFGRRPRSPPAVWARCVFAMAIATSVDDVVRADSPTTTAAAPKATDPVRPFHSGRYVLVQKTDTLTEIPVVGDARASTTAIMLFDLAAQDREVRGKGEMCSLHIVSHPDLLRPVLPKAYVNAVGPLAFNGRLKRDERGERLDTARSVVVLGANLRAIDTEPLPTDADDPRVSDSDRDGKPGVTMFVEGLATAEVFMVTRRWDQLAGRRQGVGKFAGAVIHSQEQTLLGASTPLLRAMPNMRPDLELSEFALVRVKKDTACKDVEHLRIPDTTSLAPVVD